MFTRPGRLFIQRLPTNLLVNLSNVSWSVRSFYFGLNLHRFCTVRLHKWDCKLYAVFEGNQLGDGFLLRACLSSCSSFSATEKCLRGFSPKRRRYRLELRRRRESAYTFFFIRTHRRFNSKNTHASALSKLAFLYRASNGKRSSKQQALLIGLFDEIKNKNVEIPLLMRSISAFCSC